MNKRTIFKLKRDKKGKIVRNRYGKPIYSMFLKIKERSHKSRSN